MTRERALVINVTLLHDWQPQALLLAPVMKQKIGKEILIFGRCAVACNTQRSVADLTAKHSEASRTLTLAYRQN
jgi:hypothetical protein